MINVIDYAIAKKEWEGVYGDTIKFGSVGRNLAQGTNTDKWMAYVGSRVSQRLEGGAWIIRAEWDGVSKTWGLRQNHPYMNVMKLTVGETYTLSFKARGTVGMSLGYVYIMNNGNTNESVGGGRLQSETEFQTITAKWTKRLDAESSYVMISNQGDTIPGQWFEVCDVKVEKGDKSTPYIVAPEDAGLHPFVTKLSEIAYQSKANEEDMKELKNAVTSMGGLL